MKVITIVKDERHAVLCDNNNYGFQMSENKASYISCTPKWWEIEGVAE